ncbi:TetR family transcriptional regulator [Rhodococcus sp. AD45-ID]|uniref:TetR/AcrR family transcriptional regulator n=1 Tax=Rhodococcus TaxID=1827 RepID=UPI0005D33759|nr:MULTISPECIES: TetR/AcrR family transcriptional regulator [unclassified Rhodococcus (in: high G+C Gram-positive bacteria)]KJF21861.1 TetR family transcriptional regulator [Rhodococcus sp. AD45]PSR39571.1 TetR family transcriptional regulator [Rhodococcus sp. AD45-ID]RZL23563.1 MAG: TetR family transcriptional regulator [Rhodococcus sp. (in: high G+C Gram-positive bacteria)]
MAAGDIRTSILDAVLHIVATEGISGVSNRRIASDAGVSLGSVTYHFPSQSDMLRAALSRFAAEETARILELVEQYRDQDLSAEDAAAATESIAQDIAFVVERIAPFEMFVAAGRDHELHQIAAECFAAYDSLGVAVLTALGAPDPESVASYLVAMIVGLQLRRLATGIDNADVASSILLVLKGAAP